MLGRKKHSRVISTLGRLLELEKMEYGALYIDDCTEKQLIRELKSAELYLLCAERVKAADDEPAADCTVEMLEAIAAGYLSANKGHFVIYSTNPSLLGDVYYGEPAVQSIGEAIAHVRREKRISENNKLMHDARRIISEAHLSFSSKGFVEAVEYGMYRETQAFLQAGFSTETENGEGVPLLSLAVRNGDIEICRLLMSYGASMNIIARDRCSSPVLDAVIAVKPGIAELLIDGGADLNFKNRNGQSALIVAIGARMEEISNLLIDKGADLTIRDSLGMSAYDYAKLFSLADIQKKLEA